MSMQIDLATFRLCNIGDFTSLVNEAQEPDDDVLSARDEFIAPGHILFHRSSG